uniref:Uncharacterized protein n=1 Tax=Hyaloperonospora arabidopsidis (strain Emoy2) TaxID=559515 RepID=M4BJ04_HYAAE
MELLGSRAVVVRGREKRTTTFLVLATTKGTGVRCFYSARTGNGQVPEQRRQWRDVLRLKRDELNGDEGGIRLAGESPAILWQLLLLLRLWRWSIEKITGRWPSIGGRGWVEKEGAGRRIRTASVSQRLIRRAGDSLDDKRLSRTTDGSWRFGLLQLGPMSQIAGVVGDSGML